MSETITLLTLAIGGAVAFYLWLNVHWRRMARQRLVADVNQSETVARTRDRPFPHRHRLLPLLLGAAVGGVLYLAGMKPVYCVAGGIVVGLLGWQIEQLLVERNIQKIELQLADAIDLMVGALRAGVSVSSALENALQESRWPLRPQLEQVVGRIRLGDEPQDVFREFTARVPLETFTLLATALSVHWEVGGNLAPTLATVGRTIRDRIELSRRIRSMSAQSRISTFAILGTTYFIALVMWRSDPARMAEFLATSIGSTLVAAAIFLQAVGIVWGEIISRVKY
jgi:tight adherence protein B